MLHVQCVHVHSMACPHPRLRLTEALPFGMSPDCHQNKEITEYCQVNLKYFTPKQLTSPLLTFHWPEHALGPYLISSVGSVPLPCA